MDFSFLPPSKNGPPDLFDWRGGGLACISIICAYIQHTLSVRLKGPIPYVTRFLIL